MYDDYFTSDGEVRPEFRKEFVSIFSGWLGTANLHKLDEVTEAQWSRFNDLLKALYRSQELHLVNLENESCSKVENIETILETFAESQRKDFSQFTHFVIPELDAVFTEEWDYTWVLWHRGNGAVEALAPLVADAGLHHWNDP